jgi:hypothetical protein
VTKLLLCPVPGCHGPDGRPRELTGGPLCQPCRRRAGSALAWLPELYVHLRNSDRLVATQSERISGSGDPEAINLGYRVLATEICTLLVDWADVARGLFGMAPRHTLPVREGFAVQAAADVLCGSGEKLWNHPAYGADLATGVLRLKRRAWKALGMGDNRVHLALACPQCGLKALCRHSGGTEHVSCLHCEARWDEDGYRHLVLVMLDVQRQRAAEAVP